MIKPCNALWREEKLALRSLSYNAIREKYSQL
jgi:hypothetical protein